jgi:hypothetical protein
VLIKLFSELWNILSKYEWSEGNVVEFDSDGTLAIIDKRVMKLKKKSKKCKNSKKMRLCLVCAVIFVKKHCVQKIQGDSRNGYCCLECELYSCYHCPQP